MERDHFLHPMFASGWTVWVNVHPLGHLRIRFARHDPPAETWKKRGPLKQKVPERRRMVEIPFPLAAATKRRGKREVAYLLLGRGSAPTLEDLFFWNCNVDTTLSPSTTASTSVA